MNFLLDIVYIIIFLFNFFILVFLREAAKSKQLYIKSCLLVSFFFLVFYNYIRIRFVAICILISYGYFIKLLEYSILIIVSIQSMYLLLISNNGGMSYLLLELISICFYILRVLVSNLKRGKNKLALNKYYFRLLKKNKKKCI